MAEDVIKVILTQGILGVIAALFIGLYLAEKSAHGKTREGNLLRERELMQAQLTLQQQNSDLRETHAVRERQCLQIVEDFAKSLVNAVEELGRVAATIRKINERRTPHR